MDDKVFASASMTAAMSGDPSEYEAIPAVHIFDQDFSAIRATNAIAVGRKSRSRSLVWRAAAVLPLIIGAYLLLASCQGGGY